MKHRKRKGVLIMENQYNYYKPEDNNNMDNGYGYQQGPQEPQKPKKPFPKKAVAIALSAVLIGGLAGAAFEGGSYLTSKALNGNGSSTTSTSSNKVVSSAQLTTANSSVTSDISTIVENAMPSIVSITNMSVQKVQSFFGGYQEVPSESAGSGIIVGQNDSELLIVTNNHVVENSETLTVTFCNEESIEASVKGTDSTRDLAVVAVPLDSIPDDTMSQIKTAVIGNSDSLKVGEPAIAIGNALGYGQSVTTGIISAKERSIEGYDGSYIQTDAAINPGNSGGALLNINGEVIGINSAKISDSTVEGMGFAIPISDVSDIIQNLMNKETRTKVAENEQGYLGIKGYDVNETGAQMYNMPTGVYIAEVTKNGAADKAGLSKGTIITAFDGNSVTSMDGLKGQLAYYKVGETVTVTVQVPENNGEYTESEVEVTLTKSPSTSTSSK
mgnify:FL=1